MANAWARDRAGLFYFGFGFYALAAVFVGFSTTYLIPVARRSFEAPPVLHFHGEVALSWVVFFFAQQRSSGASKADCIGS